MTATMGEVRGWVQEGKASGASHVIIVYDGFDHEVYPVYVGGSQDYNKQNKTLAERLAHYANPNGMQRVTEVYSMQLDLETQLREHRAYHLD